ncbi:NADH-quinone oxidoreductase subunit A [Allgaiera indica]|uniref:NADH-quinone oxidoreductase subunit A n=1 Tax=Allgaiera indica TaxID=765699 RepID=UPI001FCD8717|nr:NADH-quinone oxidoreductase subunit A [Allgaiera indica]
MEYLGCRRAADDRDCRDARRVAMFCNGVWCGQSPAAIRKMTTAGLPAKRILYDRNRMQGRLLQGLSVWTPGGTESFRIRRPWPPNFLPTFQRRSRLPESSHCPIVTDEPRRGGLVLTQLAQYAILLGLTLGAFAFVASLYALARAIGRSLDEPGKDVPASSGTLSRDPVWVRYHAKYFGYALLFLAFDMEMAFMYPWAVVYREEGLVALLDMGVFLAILFLGLLYGWSQGALRRQ